MSDHTMDEQYVAELLARLAAARKARREAELVAADQASELDHLRAVIRNVLAEPEADDKKLAGGLGTIAWLLRFLIQGSPQPQGLLQAAKEAAKLQKDQLETMSPILYRLNQAATAAVGLSEHAPEDEILGRLAELRQILHDLVGEDALDAKELVTKAKAKIQDLKRSEELAVALDTMLRALQRRVSKALRLRCQDDGPGLDISAWPLGEKLEAVGDLLREMVPEDAENVTEEAIAAWFRRMDGADFLLQVMVPYSTDNRVEAAVNAWQAAGRRSALFQKTGQELGLTDSASPEQILQRAQEVAMILRSRSQAQDFDANLLAMLGLPANTSRDAVLDAVKALVAFRDGRASVDDFTKYLSLSLSELPVGTKCVAVATVRALNKRTAFGACTSFTVKEIAPDKSSVFIANDQMNVGFWVDPIQPAVLSNAINK